MANKILIVDDDEVLRGELKDSLEDYIVIEASSGEAALALLQRAHDIGVVILDVVMSGMSGLDVLSKIRKIDPEMGIIILTGYSTKDTVIEALQSKADDFIEKPIDINRINNAVERLFRSQNRGRNVESLDIKGKMERVKNFIDKNCYKKTHLNDAAQAVCLSPKYLSRVFKEYLGMGFSDYKLKVKVDRAKELLVKFGYNVNQVSEKLGYENTESFIRQFKKITKHTPTEYRKKMEKKNISRKK